MAWHNESRRHALASKGISTGTKGKPIFIQEPYGLPRELQPTGKFKTEEEYYVPKTISISSIKNANERAGYYFFSPSSVKFFNSRVDNVAYLKKGSTTQGYFITSEKYENSYSGASEPRKYTIRKFDLKTGDVDTQGDFQAYDTKAEAKKEIQKLLGAKIKSQRPFRWQRSQQYRNAKKEDIDKFVGLKSKEYEGRSFTIDESEARLIVANLKKSEYDDFKKKFQQGTVSEFRLLQDYVGEYS